MPGLQVCRRAERAIAPLYRADAVDSSAYAYLNRQALIIPAAHHMLFTILAQHRLSDFLFVAARFAAQRQNQPESIYRPPVGEREAKLVVRQPAPSPTADNTGNSSNATST
jgi:cob(I)alamin adenosyltransferase